MLCLEGMGGISILYKGYVEPNLTFPDLPWYNEDVMFLVVSDNKYGERVPGQIGTQVIGHLVVTMSKKDFKQSRETVNQVHLSTVISKRNTVKGLNVPEYNVKVVKGIIHAIREVLIPPFMTTVVKGIMNLMTHSKCMNVDVEPVTGYLDHIAMARSYGVLKPERAKIDICLRSHNAKQITLPKQTAMGEIPVTNVILALLVPKPTEHEAGKVDVETGKRKYESQKELLDKIDLTGLGELSQNEHKEAW